MKSKKNLLLIALIMILCLFGGTYAYFNYYGEGGSHKIVAGKVNLILDDGTNAISLINAFPETKEEARSRTGNTLTFTVSGVNTTLDHDIWYEVMLNEGDPEEGRTRLNPEDLVFDLIELNTDGTEGTYLVDALSYADFNARRIWVNTVFRETSLTVDKTYKLRMWIDEDVIISNTDPNASYSTSVFENSYASVKVSVYGDFVEKNLPYNYLANLGVEGSTFWPESIETEKANITNINFVTMTEDLINNRYGVASIKEDVTDTTKSNGGGVKAWLETNSDDSTKYTMYVASDGITFLPEDSSRMFNEFSVLESVLFENINTRYATTMERMFRSCGSLIDVDVSGFDTSNVTNMSVMFQDCSALSNLDVSGFDTSQVTIMSYMFNYCSSLTKLDVGDWDTSKVTTTRALFQSCIKLESLDVSNWKTSNVTDMAYMFCGTKGYKMSLTDLDLGNWDTSQVTTMKTMFQNCVYLTKLELSDWETGNVKDMSYMFNECISLATLDVSNWDTSKVTNMKVMFQNCINLVMLNVSDWDTSQVTDMSGMFCGGSGNKMSLVSLDVSNWNTSKVTNMMLMFQSCINLESLDVSNWNTSSVTDTSYMFNACSNLVTIYANTDWSTGKVTVDTSANMFSGCTSLVGATSYSDSNANDITMANPTTGYFTKKTA